MDDLVKEFPEQEKFIMKYFKKFKIYPPKEILRTRRIAFEGARLAGSQGAERRFSTETLLIKE
jgi:hypothetical protein